MSQVPGLKLTTALVCPAGTTVLRVSDSLVRVMSYASWAKVPAPGTAAREEASGRGKLITKFPAVFLGEIGIKASQENNSNTIIPGKNAVFIDLLNMIGSS
jgi:hypothetical protein